jgi:hypothetical protein
MHRWTRLVGDRNDGALSQTDRSEDNEGQKENREFPNEQAASEEQHDLRP